MDITELLVEVFRFLHFLGLAALLGGLLVQIGPNEKRVNPPVLWGAVAQLVTGIVLLLLTLAEANHLKVTVKLALLAVVVVMVLVARRRAAGGVLSLPAYVASLGLTVVNTGLAVFW